MGEECQKIFLKPSICPFTRMEETEANRTQGTGLGMAIAKSILDLMGGTIHVESTLGKGSIFTVDVDIELGESELIGEEKKGQNPLPGNNFSFAGRRILIVEDNEVNEEILRELLHIEGALTESAKNGQEAVDIFKKSPPDIFSSF